MKIILRLPVALLSGMLTLPSLSTVKMHGELKVQAAYNTVWYTSKTPTKFILSVTQRTEPI